MAEPVIQGWCPGALRPMPSGDGWILRVRPPGGRLTPQQAREIARLSRAHGNGTIDLSSRANIQLRGVTERSYAPLLQGLDALDLIDDNAEAEERRNIVVAPFWNAGDGSVELATELAHVLTAPNAPRRKSDVKKPACKLIRAVEIASDEKSGAANPPAMAVATP